MRKVLPLLLLCLSWSLAHSQDFSNKGKEFWIGYGNHASMFGANGQTMSLYITSDVNTTGVIEIPGIAWFSTFSVTANQVTTVTIPQTAALNNEGLHNKGIRVVAQRPVVVYSHIYDLNASGATLCLPTTTLGREYISINYTQASNTSNSHSYFFVLATEDNTTVEIIPTRNTLGGWAANSINTVTLNKGQIYQVLATSDLTGSSIKSVPGPSGGCKRIAVFSGSGRLYLGCQNANSSDNLYQQVYPGSTWGKKYITVPSHNNNSPNHINYYRIIKSTPSAVVNLNGSILPQGSFVNNLYYEFNNTQTNVITSDDPIMVVQYFSSQACGAAPSDPEMIFLNPIEQTISNVTLFSSPNFLINYHGLNIVVKKGGTALSSMKLDGGSITNRFVDLPQDPANYAYARIAISAGTHNLVGDSGFNAIAFGFGDFESYGYSAGTNLKDLYQFINIQNDYSTVTFPAGCKNTPFRFGIVLPYAATQIKWEFGPALNAMGLNDTTITAPVPDSSWVVNGRTLNRYRIIKNYIIPTAGTYPISVIANNPTTNGCSGEQEIQYDLQVYEQPDAAFTFTHTGCLSDSVAFIDNTNGQGRPVVSWSWDFGDGNTSTVKNPKHKYNTSAPSFTIKHWAVTDIGCLSDTAETTIPISNPPLADFTFAPVRCERDSVLFTDQSDPAGSTIVKWTWNFGDNTGDIVRTNGNPIKHYFATAGTYKVKLFVESITGCKSLVDSFDVVINARPDANFQSPAGICLPQGTAQFTDLSTISDGTQSQFSWQWDFGDAGTSAVQNPVHNYGGVGPYTVRLIVTSNNSCADTASQVLSNIYAQPTAVFTATPEVCLGTAASFTDQSNGNGNSVTRWRWDFGDGNTDTVRNPTHTYAAAGNYTVTLYVFSDKGCVSATTNRQVVVNPLPQAAFTVTPPTCVNGSVSFLDASQANAGNLVKWDWKFGDAGTSNVQNPTHTYAATGTYTVTLDIETDKGCKNTTAASRTVVINPLPAPDFGLPDICSNDPFAEFTDSSTIADGSESQFTYLWNFGDPNANAGNPNTSTARNGRHQYTVAGTYTVRLTVTSKDGCSAFREKQFVVNSSLPQAGFNINSTDFCSNKTITIADASSIPIGRILSVEIYWDYQNDPTKKTVDNNPAAGKTYTYKYPEFGSPLTKDYEIRYVVYSGNTCLNQISQTVTIKATPGIQFNALAGVCEEITPFQVTAASETFGLAGTGVFSGPGISPTGQFDPRAARPGTHTIRYTYNAANGCTNYDEETIQVYPTPLVNAGPDRVVLEGGFVQLATTITGNNLTYLWTPVTGLDNPTIAQPKVAPPADTEYTLTVTSGDGCVATDKVLVTLLKQIKVPNAFSPNGDGINDRWEILYLDSYPDCEVEVFNRYGQPVFRSVGYSRPWDGTWKGTPLPVGTYYWIINPKNGRQPLNGSVTIIK